MTKIITAGRTDLNDFFATSGAFNGESPSHTPLLVFVAKNDIFVVLIIHKPNELLSFPDETDVMGQWRSDYFQVTVGQYHQYTETHSPQKRI